MKKAWEFIKKYHIIPYFIILIGIVLVSYVVKWHHYGTVYHILREDAHVVYDYFNVILGIVVLGYTLIYAFLVTKASIGKLYLAGAITGSILFMLIVTPFAAADENNHIYKCLDLSNLVFGYEMPEDEKTHWLRDCEAFTKLGKKISIENYYYTAKNMFKTVDDDGMSLQRIGDIVCNNKDIIYYFPGVTGLTLGRALNLSEVATFTLGRLFTIAACVFLNYLALRKMPFYKTGFALVLLMPSVVSRIASITYDGMLMSYIFLFVAYVMHYIHSDETIKIKDAIIMILTGIALTVGKGGAYVPFLLLLFLIPKKNFGTKIKYPVIVAGSIFICLLAYCLCNLSLFTDIKESTQGTTNDLLWTEEKGYTLHYIITNPVHSVKLLAKTLISYGYQWYGELIGDGFGWLQIYVSPFLTLIYTLLIAVSALNINGEERSLSNKTRIVSMGVVLFSAALVILSMWIFWTPLNYGIIAGVQGRYFIPVFMLVVLAIKNKTTIIKKDVSGVLLFAAYLISVMACFNIWIEC